MDYINLRKLKKQQQQQMKTHSVTDQQMQFHVLAYEYIGYNILNR